MSTDVKNTTATETEKPTSSDPKKKIVTKTDAHENLPPVSKQTAGGIAGAMVGGLVAGPIGAIVVGVAGAMVGNASAAGHRPVEKTVDAIKDVTEEPARKAYKSLTHAFDSKKKKAAAKKKATAKKETGSKKKAASSTKSTAANKAG